MDSALAWVGWIAEWVGRFIPRREILDTTEGAIKYVGGSKPVVCAAGVHWYWPWRSTFVLYPTARQTDRLETQTMETEDGITFIVSGAITYQVDDLMALVTTTHSPTTAIVDLALLAVHDVCSDYTWSDLKAAQRKGRGLPTKLRNEAQSLLSAYGVKVLQLRLTTLARCRVFKVSQSTSTEEN